MMSRYGGMQGGSSNYDVQYKHRSPWQRAALCLGGALLGASLAEGFGTGASEAAQRYVHSEIGKQNFIGRALGPVFAEGKVKKSLRRGVGDDLANPVYSAMRKRAKHPEPHYRNAFFGSCAGAGLLSAGKRKRLKCRRKK